MQIEIHEQIKLMSTIKKFALAYHKYLENTSLDKDVELWEIQNNYEHEIKKIIGAE